MKNSFSKPHLEEVLSFWERLLTPGDLAIDATCGNGHDTLKLAELCNNVIAIDIQKQAIEQAKQLISTEMHVQWFHQSHETFPPDIKPESVTLITYNLGYLPKGDKNLITKEKTSAESLKAALPLIKSGGAITMVCYRGHEGGAEEESSLLKIAGELDKRLYLVSYSQWINRENHPTVLKIMKL